MLNNSTAKCFFIETASLQTWENLDSLNIFCVVLHALSFLPAAIGNAVITVTTFKTPSLQKPSFVLLSCAAFADSLTGFLAQPVAMASFVAKLRRQFTQACWLDVIKECLGWLFGGISVSILALLSVERYLVLYLGLRYYAVVTVKRLLLIVAVFWFSMMSLGILRFYALSNETFVAIQLPFMFLGLLILTASYCRINHCIKQHRLIEPAPSEQDLEASSFDIGKYKKITLAVFYIVCFYWLFLAPFVCVLVAYLFVGFTERIEGAYYVTTTVVLVNAAVNPVLYCWRLRTLRQAVWKNVKQILHLESE